MKLKFRLLTLLSAILIVSAFLFCFALGVHAQEDGPAEPPERTSWGIIITPSVFHLTVERDSVYNDTVNLVNDFQHRNTVVYYPHSANFGQKGETGEPEIYYGDDLPLSANAADWISFQDVNYTIPYGVKAASNFTITVPPDAEPGGHYVVLLYSDSPNGKHEDSGISLEQTIGALLFITVPGNVVEQGELVEFTTDKPIYELLPVTFFVRYKNTGNIHTQVGGNIFITKGGQENQVAILTVNEEIGFTLPGSIRNYIEIYEGGWITRGEDGSLQFNNDKFPDVYWGKYTALLRLKHTVDGERVTTEEMITFWVIPWRMLLLVLGVVVLVVALFSRGRVRRKRRNKRSQNGKR